MWGGGGGSSSGYNREQVQGPWNLCTYMYVIVYGLHLVRLVPGPLPTLKNQEWPGIRLLAFSRESRIVVRSANTKKKKNAALCIHALVVILE